MRDEMRAFVSGLIWATQQLWQKGRSRGMHVSHARLKSRHAGSTRLQHCVEHDVGSIAVDVDASHRVRSSASIISVGLEHVQEKDRPVGQSSCCRAPDITRGCAERKASAAVRRGYLARTRAA